MTRSAGAMNPEVIQSAWCGLLGIRLAPYRPSAASLAPARMTHSLAALSLSAKAIPSRRRHGQCVCQSRTSSPRRRARKTRSLLIAQLPGGRRTRGISKPHASHLILRSATPALSR